MFPFKSPHFNPIGRAVFLLLFAGLVSNCEHAGPLETEIDAGEPVTLATIQPIFTQNCALSGCHVGASALMGLDLSDGQAYANLVEQQSLEAPSLPLVSPFNPDSSYLVMKLEGSPQIATGTLVMPIGRSPLDQEVINTIRTWIAEGALEN